MACYYNIGNGKMLPLSSLYYVLIAIINIYTMSLLTMLYVIVDLQPAPRRYSGAWRRARGTSHHRDQLAERRRRPTRTDRQPTRHLRRRGT